MKAKGASKSASPVGEPFRRIYETNVVGLSLSDFEGRFIHANDETLRIVGYKRADLEADKMNWKSMTPLEDLTKDAAAVREMHAKGHCTPYKKEYIRKDGSRVPVLVAFALVKENLAFGTIVDLTAQKAMVPHRATPDSTLGLAVLETAHKANNKLSAILANTELALSSTENQTAREHLVQVLASAKEAAELIKALVDYTTTPGPKEKVWSKRNRVYKYKTSVGVFTIAPDISNPAFWALSLGPKILRSYPSPAAAAEAVVKRSTGDLVWDSADSAVAPDDLGGWDPV